MVRDMSVSIKDKININLREKLNDLSSYQALIGINKDDAQQKKLYYTHSKKSGNQIKESDVTLGEVAAVHEFGCPARNIPERSFLRATIKEQNAEIKSEITKEINSFLNASFIIIY